MAIGALTEISAGLPTGLKVADSPVRRAEEMECLCNSPVEGVKVARGVLGMIALEVVAALLLYGLWEAWHLLRAAH